MLKPPEEPVLYRDIFVCIFTFDLSDKRRCWNFKSGERVFDAICCFPAPAPFIISSNNHHKCRQHDTDTTLLHQVFFIK